jgi:hypothetical protein
LLRGGGDPETRETTIRGARSCDRGDLPAERSLGMADERHDCDRTHREAPRLDRGEPPRVEGLRNVATGRSDHRPDESPVAQDVVDLVEGGKDERGDRALPGVDRCRLGHAQAVVAGALTPAPYRSLFLLSRLTVR